MKNVFYPFLILLVMITSCNQEFEPSNPIKEIASRDGIYTYICCPPIHWQELPLPLDVDLNDSTLPLMSWRIDDALLVVIHNFPDQQIPPQAQINRWEKQLKNADPSTVTIEPTAWGGFEGLRLYIADYEGQGILAWAMTLPIFHRYALQGSPRESHWSADWTIKVTGPALLIQENEEDLDTFARSFRLRREIP